MYTNRAFNVMLDIRHLAAVAQILYEKGEPNSAKNPGVIVRRLLEKYIQEEKQRVPSVDHAEKILNYLGINTGKESEYVKVKDRRIRRVK